MGIVGTVSTADIRHIFEDFGVKGLSLIHSRGDVVELDFADSTYVRIELRPLGRCDVMIHVDGRDEPVEHQGLDIWGLIALLKGEGKGVRL